MNLEKNSHSIHHAVSIIASEVDQHIHKQPTHLTNIISEFIGVFIFVVCAETMKLSYLMSGNHAWPRNLAIIYSCPLIFVFIYALFIPCPRLMNVHLNPGLTLSLTIFGKSPAKDLLPYLLAQLFGATFGALCVHAGYHLYTGSMAEPEHQLFPRHSFIATSTIEWVFAMVASMFIHFDVNQSKREMSHAGPGCIRWLSAMYWVMVVVFFEERPVSNTAYGMGVLMTSWILPVEPLALQWSCAVTTFVSLPAFIAGGALEKLHHPEKISRADSTEKCMEPRGSIEHA